MSDTPRTDSAVGQHDPWGQSTQLVLAGFARQLERELAEAQECLREAVEITKYRIDKIELVLPRWRKAAGMEAIP
jgi:hypothetical protein